MTSYDEFEGPEDRARGPRHAPQIDPAQGTDIERRMAAMLVRHYADQHGCQARSTGSCDHPNHRRDIDFLQELLATIGLDAAYPAYSPDEKRVWVSWLGQSGPPEADLQDAA